jgi:hypothetical protein
MAGHGKYYELLDMPKFAAPDILNPRAQATAFKLLERVGRGGFMSYGQIWPRFDVIVKGYATDDFIESSFTAYKDQWKNKAIQAAFRLLRDYFQGFLCRKCYIIELAKFSNGSVRLLGCDR